MKFNDIIKLSLNNLMYRKLRSWLTIVGIVIGVAAVVSIVSISSGAQKNITAQLGGLGADIITVTPGFTRAQGMGFRPSEGDGFGTTTQDITLTNKDIQIIKSVPEVQFVNGVVSGRAEVTYLTENVSLSVEGVDPLAWKEITTSELESGRYLTSGDGNDIVIGNRIANEVFKEPLLLNTRIVIEGKSFKIVGILEESGSTGFGGGGDDRKIFMLTSEARTILENIDTDEFSSIEIKVSDPKLTDEIIENMEEKLIILRHVTEDTKDFTITSVQAIQETISNVTGTLSLFLGGIAAISLLVGAVGIANTMFMSVMERTRQIGVLKSLGTTNFEVMKLFIIESALIGLIGGLIGIFSGFIGSGIISEVGIGMGMPVMRGGSVTVITPELILFALGFSVFIGALSGLLPAKRAAGLQPVEALRYE